ncbi:MAG: hypothetical protein J6I64_08570, partial [Lachnospiraceae bacterium]|nr:hypothetical protein [Lachnospiraceae bacterium]
MGNLILNFLQQQGIIVVLGLMVAGGIFSQIMASRRYRRLRAGIQSLAAPQVAADRDSGIQTASGMTAEPAVGEWKKSRRTSRRQEVGRSAPEIVGGSDQTLSRRQRLRQETETAPETLVHTQPQESQQEVDSQLLYLKQSLDRIAAGRDQKLEEETRE